MAEAEDLDSERNISVFTNLNCSGIEYHNFDAVAVLNAWTRRQRNELNLRSAVLSLTYQCVSYMLEYTALLSLFAPTETGDYIFTLVLYTLSGLTTFWIFIVMKSESWKGIWSYIRSITLRGICDDAMQLFLVVRPLRLGRTLLYYACQKRRILGREFIHGETVTKDQLHYIIKINKDELTEAREDLYEAFIQGIPMAFLQCYFLFNLNPDSNEYCYFRDVWRVVLVALYLTSAVTTSVSYEKQKDIYEASLHVKEYVSTNGRYPMPDLDEGRSTTLLRIICHFTSICARFYLLQSLCRLHWGFGLACFLLLYASNWLIVSSNPSILCIVENLPEGISPSISSHVDRFINTFTSKETRFFEFSDWSYHFFSVRIRVPIVCSQIFTFIIPYFMIYSFFSLFASHFNNQNSHLVLSTEKNSTCPYPDKQTFGTNFLKAFGTVMSFFASYCDVGPPTSKQFIRGTELHWILFYLYFIFSYAHSYYKNKYPILTKRCYPIQLACDYIQLIFETIYEKHSAESNPELLRNLLKRLLFLISVDLETFAKVNTSFQELDSDKPDIDKWWDTQIMLAIQKSDSVRVRYRRMGLRYVTSEGHPLQSELEGVRQIMEVDHVCLSLYEYCVRQLDHILLNEITSDRISKTLNIFEISSKKACYQIRNKNRK